MDTVDSSIFWSKPESNRLHYDIAYEPTVSMTCQFFTDVIYRDGMEEEKQVMS